MQIQEEVQGGVEGEESHDMKDETLQLHSPVDDDLEQNLQGEVEDSVASFIKHCVSTPATNQDQRKWVDKFPLPKMEEVIPPKLHGHDHAPPSSKGGFIA